MSRTLKALITAAAALGLWAGAAEAQEPLPTPKVTPIQVTGPPAQRLNLIVMGDGYQKDQQSLFREDLDRNLSVLWSTEPFRSYRNYINVYSVELASVDYGVRCDPDGRKRACRRHDPRHRASAKGRSTPRTPRCACSTTTRPAAAAPLRSRAASIYGGAPPGCEAAAPYYPAGREPLRDRRPGAGPHPRQLRRCRCSASRARRRTCRRSPSSTRSPTAASAASHATTSGGSPQGPLISLHELGHSLGTLADEYPYFERDVVRPCFTGSRAERELRFHHTLITSAAQMITAQAKWFRWLGEECHVRRQDRPLGGRRTTTRAAIRRPCAALDDALARLRLRPDRPRAHGRPHQRPAQLRPDERAEHARRERSRRIRSCGSRPATRASTRSRSRGGSAARPARSSPPPRTAGTSTWRA